MEIAKFVSAEYNESTAITHQGNRSSINKYLREGYYVREERSGNWLLVKPAKVIVCLKDLEGKIYHFNIKKDILEHYGRKKISSNLFSRFEEEATEGKIKFYVDNGYCILI